MVNAAAEGSFHCHTPPPSPHPSRPRSLPSHTLGPILAAERWSGAMLTVDHIRNFPAEGRRWLVDAQRHVKPGRCAGGDDLRRWPRLGQLGLVCRADLSGLVVPWGGKGELTVSTQAERSGLTRAGEVGWGGGRGGRRRYGRAGGAGEETAGGSTDAWTGEGDTEEGKAPGGQEGSGDGA
eukprot:scaffold22631_cov86-Isochrysis_galbana.AAC.2